MKNNGQRVRSLSMKQLRKMIKEEADGLATGNPEDVSAKEEPWEDEKGVKDVDQLAAQGVKKEARLRRLRVEAARLSRRLRECRRAIRSAEYRINESRQRSRRARPSARSRRRS